MEQRRGIVTATSSLRHFVINYSGKNALKFGAAFADAVDMDISAIALQGLDQADAHLNSATVSLANAGANSPDGTSLDVVRLSSQIVALSSVQIQVELSLASLKTADQIQQTAINLLA